MAASQAKICPVCQAKYDGGEVFCPVDGGRLTTPSQAPANIGEPRDPLVGTTLDQRYLIKKRIGEGGMGIVYAGQHVVIDKRVAVKVLRDDFSRRTDVVERFRQEAKSASRIANEHIVDISDFGETPSGESYFVMEFLDGEDLSRVLARESTLTADRAIRIALQCCDALGAAHEAGIVHRDMKPENVFLVRRGSTEDFVKIVDFGIAKMNDIETEGAPGRKLTKTGMIFGTPEYMSPEQASGKELDHRVDVYALGVIMYEMMVGRVPFVGDTFMGILTQQMFEPPPPVQQVNPKAMCPPEFEALIFRTLSKKPEERFQTMADLAAALKKLQVGGMERASQVGTFVGYGEPVQPAERTSKLAETNPVRASSFPPPSVRVNRTPAIVGVALAAVAVIGGFIAFATNGSREEPSAAASPGPAVVASAPARGKGAAPVPTQVATAAGADRVLLRVQRDPAHATFTVDGVAMACEEGSSTCDLQVQVNAPVRVRGEAEGYEPCEIVWKTAFNGDQATGCVLKPKRSKRKPGVQADPGSGGKPPGDLNDLKSVPELK